MKITDQLRTGWRNLTRQKLRTSLTIFAIVIGAVAVTVMLSLVTSAQGFLTTQFTKTGEDRRVIATAQVGLSYREAQWGSNNGDSSVKLTDDNVTKLAAIPNVAHATPVFAQGVWGSASVEGGAEVKLRDFGTLGYVPNGAIRHDVIAGRDLDPSDAKTGVVVTQVLANDLGFKGNYPGLVGKKITFSPRADMIGKMDPAKQMTMSGGMVEPATLTVSGVIASDDRSAFVTMEEIRVLSTMTRTHKEFRNGSSNPQTFTEVEDRLAQSGYGSIYLDVDEKKNVDAVVQAVKSMGLGAAAGKEEISNQQQAFTIIGAVLGGLGGIALFVAAIGVINTMVMATLERTREIGIMRAVGATKKTIRRLFTVEAAVLGFLGGVVGVGLSFAVTVLLNSILNNQLKDSGVTARDVVSVPVALALLVIAGTTLIGIVAGGLPARRAANLDPVEALRHE